MGKREYQLSFLPPDNSSFVILTTSSFVIPKYYLLYKIYKNKYKTGITGNVFNLNNITQYIVSLDFNLSIYIYKINDEIFVFLSFIYFQCL